MLSAIGDMVVSIILRLFNILALLTLFGLFMTANGVMWVLAVVSYLVNNTPFAPYILFASGPLSYTQLGDFAYVSIPIDVLVTIYTIYLIGALAESVSQTIFYHQQTEQGDLSLSIRPVRIDYSLLVGIFRDAVGATAWFVLGILLVELVIAFYNAFVRTVAVIFQTWANPQQLTIFSIYASVGALGTALGFTSGIDQNTYFAYTINTILIGLVNFIISFIATFFFFLPPLVTISALVIGVSALLSQFQFQLASKLADVSAWLERWSWRFIAIAALASAVLTFSKPFIFAPYQAIWSTAMAVMSANLGLSTNVAKDLDAKLSQMGDVIQRPSGPCSLTAQENSCANVLYKPVVGLLLTTLALLLSVAIGWVAGGSISLLRASKEFVVRMGKNEAATSNLRRTGLLVFQSQSYVNAQLAASDTMANLSDLRRAVDRLRVAVDQIVDQIADLERRQPV